MSPLSWNSLVLAAVVLASSTEASWFPRSQRVAPASRVGVPPVVLNGHWGLSATEILRGGSTGEC